MHRECQIWSINHPQIEIFNLKIEPFLMLNKRNDWDGREFRYQKIQNHKNESIRYQLYFSCVGEISSAWKGSIQKGFSSICLFRGQWDVFFFSRVNLVKHNATFIFDYFPSFLSCGFSPTKILNDSINFFRLAKNDSISVRYYESNVILIN